MNERELETVDGDDDESREKIDRVCDEFETAWRDQQTPSLSEYLEGFDGQEKIKLFQHLLELDIDYRKQNDSELDSEEYISTFPAMKDEVVKVLQSDTQVHPGRSKSGSDNSVADRYVLEETIGQGGMGTVHRARQVKPVQRMVAFKVIRAGMDSGAVLQRFDAERQALALMDHPHIAKVLDAGKTDQGQPFFVMEYVDGTRITSYCSENKLSLEERLRLFVDVCDAIEHAHRKGIIHRDIKPSNVLVAKIDDQPVVKVIDFGVAKAISQRLTEETLNTEVGHLVGTPEYMSPEQANLSDQDIDTRSDVFALGVLLFEVVTSTTPIDSRNSENPISVLEILRQVRESECPRVSQRIATRASQADGKSGDTVNRGSGFTQKRVERELDWIVKKSLEKDRDQRYQSVSEFAADVERFLNGEPIVAHPPSAAYRVRKFIGRHKVSVIASALILLSLVLGILGTSWGLVRAWEETENANAANVLKSKALTIAINNSQFALDALTNIVIALHDDLEGIPGTAKFRRDFMKKVSASLDQFSTDLLQQGDADYAIVQTHIKLANLFSRVGDQDDLDASDRAERHLLSAVQMAEFLYEKQNASGASMEALAYAAEQTVSFYKTSGKKGKLDELLELHLRLREEFVEKHPDNTFQKYRLLAALMDQGNVMFLKNQFAQSEKAYRRMQEILDSFPEEGKQEIQFRQLQTGVYHGLSEIARQRNDSTTSLEKLNQALSIAESLAEEIPDDPGSVLNVAEMQSAIGGLYFDNSEFAKAEEHYRESLKFHEKGVNQHSDRIDLKELLAAAMSRLGEALLEQNKSAAGREVLQQAIAILKPICEADRGKIWSHGDLSYIYEMLADNDYEAKRFVQAIDYLRESIQVLKSGSESNREFASDIAKLQRRLTAWEKQHGE